MNMKFAMIGLLVLVYAASAFALPVNIVEVEFDDQELTAGSTTAVRAIDKGESYPVEVTIRHDSSVNTTLEDVQIEISLRGTGIRDRVDDITREFRLAPGREVKEDLSLTFPRRMESGTYRLEVEIADRAGERTRETYFIEVEGQTHDVAIRNVFTSPSGVVEAGRALLVTARVQNYGTSKEDYVEFRVSIPELGIMAADFIDELDAEGGNDDAETTEELFLRIPADAASGEYTLLAEVVYDEGDETATATTTIRVIGNEQAMTQPEQPRTILSIGPESQEAAAGEDAIYPVTITNAGSEGKSYVISVEGVDFGTVSVTPSNVVVLEGGESQTVFVRVNPNSDANGRKVFTVSVKSGGKTLKQVPLSLDVEEGDDAAGTAGIRRGLEVGLVVLVVLLVILGLIIGFNKLRGPDDEDKDDGSQTYY